MYNVPVVNSSHVTCMHRVCITLCVLVNKKKAFLVAIPTIGYLTLNLICESPNEL